MSERHLEETPPALAMAHKLDSIEAVLGMVAQWQEAYHATAQDVLECKDKVTQLIEGSARQIQEVTTRLEALIQRVEARPVAADRPGWRWWRWGACLGGVLGALLVVGVAWWHWSQPPWEDLALRLDGALTQHWKGFTAEQQAVFGKVYQELRVQSPQARQQGAAKKP